MYLKNEEIKKGHIFMIDFENGDSDPFYVSSVEPGESQGSTIYRGESLSFLLKIPNLFSVETNHISDKRYALGEPNRKNLGLKGYRKMTKNEKEEWKEKIQKIPLLQPLIYIIKSS
ncbi:MAG: hypothetical protein WCI91_02855 [Candidatus Nomurabacteria bacterium]